MSQAVLSINGMSIPDAIELVTDVIESMTGNVNFATPNPTLPYLSASVVTLGQMYRASLSGDRNIRSSLSLVHAVLVSDVSKLRGYVQGESQGDADKIRSAGLAVKRKLSPKGLFAPPSNVRSVYGVHMGEIIVRWTGVKGKVAYLVQINDTPSDESKWRDYTHTTKASAVVSGLITDHEYAFRLATLTSSGYGGLSEVTKQKAL